MEENNESLIKELNKLKDLLKIQTDLARRKAENSKIANYKWRENNRNKYNEYIRNYNQKKSIKK